MKIILINRLYIYIISPEAVLTLKSWVFWYWNYIEKASLFDRANHYKLNHCIGIRLFGFTIERF